MYFAAFESLIYIITVVHIVHLLKKGRAELIQFLTLFVFGLVLELTSIGFTDVYHYGDFFVMIYTVPLCIGLMWGILVYSAMKVTDRWKLPLPARPFLDGLLVLSVDLAIDPVATHLGFWNWHMLDWYAVWFNVPLGNYFLWFVFPFLISLIWRYSPRLVGRISTTKRSDVLAPILTIVLGFAAVLIGNLIQFFPMPKLAQEVLFLAVVLGSIVVVLFAYVRSRSETVLDTSTEWIALLGPLLIHAFFLISLFFTNLFDDFLSLPVIAVVMVLVWVALFLGPSYGSTRSTKEDIPEG